MDFVLFREAEDDLVEKPPREAELFVFDNCSKGIGKIYRTMSQNHLIEMVLFSTHNICFG